MKNHGRTAFLSSLSKSFLAAPLLCIAVSSCEDSEFDKYYERPGWLESPAWNVLEERGDCKTYLSLVEKTLYAKQLEGSGSYTFFVPTDAAFSKFFEENPYGYKSVDDIPADVAADMVSYMMLFNAYPCDSLGNVLVGYNTWEIGSAYKHMTPSYDVLQRDYVNGDSIWIYDVWANASGVNLNRDWHNYRYLPVFAENYMRENGVLESDYTHFFGGNVVRSKYGSALGAQILECSPGSGDLYCENGVIHMIDQVVMPLKNLDRMIIDYGTVQKGADGILPEEASQGAWAELKDFLYHRTGDGSYKFLTYTQDVNLAHYFEKMYPTLDLSTFRTRHYTGFIPFSLNYEEYSGSVDGEDAHNSGVTMFVPTKTAMKDYVENRLLSYVDDKSDWSKAFNTLSESVLTGIWSALMSNGIIWPSQYKSAQNSIGSNEFINGGRFGNEFSQVCVGSAFASNGLYHVVNTFPKTAAFEGVGSRFLLDYRYSFMERMYTQYYPTSTYKHMLMSPLSNEDNVNITLILNSDANLVALSGVNYDAADARFENSEGEDITSYMGAMAQHGYIERDTTDRLDLEVDPLNGAYGGWAFTSTSYGDMLRYRKTGNTVNGKPEIAVQTVWSLARHINGAPAEEDELAQMPQTWAESPFSYASVTKDDYDGYNNGNVYIIEEGGNPLSYEISAKSIASYLEWYLRCDSAQSVPRHSLFKTYWEQAKSASSKPEFGSGNYTILVPTDEALQYAIDQQLMLSPQDIARKALGDPLYYDTAAYYVNVYLLSTDCFPDDGASNLYSPATWSLPSPLIDLSRGYPVSTSCKPMTEEWEDFMSGTTKMGMRLQKVGADHQLRFLGRDYESGIYVAAKAINASDIAGTRFSNTVVRELGQSNIIVPRSVIHSLDGFVLYQIQPNPSKQPVTE